MWPQFCPRHSGWRFSPSLIANVSCNLILFIFELNSVAKVIYQANNGMSVYSFSQLHFLAYFAGFAEEQNEVDYLKKRVAEEQAHARRTHRALIDTEQRLLSVERERDVFRMLARRWQSRLQQVVEEQRQRSSSAISTTMNVPTLLEGELLADDIDGESSYNSDGSSSAGEDDEFMEEETAIAPDAQSMNIDEADHLSTGDDETNENSDEYFSLGGIASGRDGGRQGSNSVLMGDVASDSDDEDAPRGNNLITGVEVLIDSEQKARAVSMSSDDL